MAGVMMFPPCSVVTFSSLWHSGSRAADVLCTKESRRRFCVGSIATRVARVQVEPPPAEYSFRVEIEEETRVVVQEQYPQLMDLVDEGTLVVVKRPVDYVERREDGYREPELVFLVGTAHMSAASAEEVTRVLQAIRPENVVVELCRSRAGMMYVEEANSTEEALVAGVGTNKAFNLLGLGGQSFPSAIGRSLQLGGRSALAFRLLLGATARRLSDSAGVATGAEFRAARRGAEAIGAQLVLGDRPIEITLQRAWSSLSWGERWRLAATLTKGIFFSKLDLSEEAMKVLKSDDAMSAMFSAMSRHFPSLLPALVYERDMYLAWSLKRSKAVNGCSRVVGVMGRGHLRGVVYALKHDQHGLRFRDLAGGAGGRHGAVKQEEVLKFIRNLAAEAAIAGILWVAYEKLTGGTS